MNRWSWTVVGGAVGLLASCHRQAKDSGATNGARAGNLTEEGELEGVGAGPDRLGQLAPTTVSAAWEAIEVADNCFDVSHDREAFSDHVSLATARAGNYVGALRLDEQYGVAEPAECRTRGAPAISWLGRAWEPEE